MKKTRNTKLEFHQSLTLHYQMKMMRCSLILEKKKLYQLNQQLTEIFWKCLQLHKQLLNVKVHVIRVKLNKNWLQNCHIKQKTQGQQHQDNILRQLMTYQSEKKM